MKITIIVEQKQKFYCHKRRRDRFLSICLSIWINILDIDLDIFFKMVIY